ncbi:MAG: hypothetical protein HQL12_08940 [Candidatus Omnitrophica bacterium]|nr:hypothetical protein [Candidatus Omnitrophota bacterium]
MLKLSLFILGFTSLIAQIVTTRELMVSFYGNEFFIGWILFGWFIWIAAGCLGARWFLNKPNSYSTFLISCHLLVSLLLPFGIFLVRLSRNFFITAPGEVPDLIPAMASSFFILAPLCLILGLQFTLACEYWKTRCPQRTTFVMSEAYFWEAIGFVLAGAAFNYKLVFLNEFNLSAMLAGLNIVPAIVLALSLKNLRLKKRMFLACFVLVFLCVLCLKNARQINFQTAALRFPNEQLLETKNSIYGNLAVTRTNGQYNFYHNGLACGTNKDDALNECLVHFPMLSHPNPKKILLVGTGFNGALREILKYSSSQVFYAEINPDLIDLAHKYISGQGWDDKRVFLFKGDLRSFFNSFPEDFDVIIVNLPNPSTAMINRYFTDDFFKQARCHLKSDGILSTHITFSPDYVSAPLEDLGASLYKTIKSQFASVIILPEDNLFLIASPAALICHPQKLIQRMALRGIHNYFVTAAYITYRYSTDRIEKVTRAFEVNKSVENFDLSPRAYYYNLIYWCGFFHQGLAGMLQIAGKIGYLFIVAACLILLALPLSFRGALRQRMITAMSLGAFSLMSAEMLVIYGFQVFYGNLYYKIATIICTVMFGMALGAYLGNRVRRVIHAGAGWVHLLIGLYFMFWLAFFNMAFTYQWPITQGAWIILALSIGILVGFEFCYIVRLVFSSDKAFSQASIYVADLIGSCLGVLMTSIFFLPVYGVYKTLLLLGLLNLAAAAGLFIHSKK